MPCTSPCARPGWNSYCRSRGALSLPRTPYRLSLNSEDVSDYQRLCAKMCKWDILEVFFIDIHLIAVAAAGALACRCAGLWGIAWPAEELHVVGDHIHLGALGSVLCLPGAVLQPPLDQDGVALLLVVGYGLAELTPRTNVEEVHLFALGTHAVDRESERTDRYPVVGE